MQQGSTGGISFLPKVKQCLKFLYHLIIIYGEVVVKSWKCAHRYTLLIFRHAAKTWLFQDVSSRYTVYVGYDVPSSMAATKAHSTDKPRFTMVYHSYTDELIHNLIKQPWKCGYVFLYDIWGGFATGPCLSSLLICHLESYPLVIYCNIAIENGYWNSEFSH
jgi:hypothetical protein